MEEKKSVNGVQDQSGAGVTMSIQAARQDMNGAAVDEALGIKIHQAVPIPPARSENNNEAKKVPVWHPIKASDYNGKKIEKIIPIIEGLLYAGLAELGSPPKMGKSYTALDVAYCVATGNDFLGHSVIRPGRVLYIDLEGTMRRVLQRYSNMGIISLPENLEFVFRDRDNEIRTIDNGLLEQISAWLDNNPDAVLIIIDMWRGVSGKNGRNENDYDAKSRMLEPLQSLALQRNVAILILLHTRKGGGKGSEVRDVFEEFIGSTAQFGSADCAWAITGKRSENEKFFSVICREDDRGEITFKVVFRDFRFQMVGSIEELAKVDEVTAFRNDPMRRTINILMRKNGGIWQGTASQLACEVSKETGNHCEESSAAGKHIRRIMPLLLSVDNIRVMEPDGNGGTKGRVYTFSQGVEQQRIEVNQDSDGA